MKVKFMYILLVITAIILFGLELSIGSVNIPMNNIFGILFGKGDVNESWRLIVIESRLPRALAATLAGACLSVGGLIMQTLFRNPLAGPHILGISAGASLGVAVVVLGFEILGIAAFLNNFKFILVVSAFFGATLVLLILFSISVRIKDLLTVLIFGILIGSISLAIVGILQYLGSEQQLKSFLIWTLGSFDGVDLNSAKLITVLGILTISLTIFLIKPLNLLLTGEEYAQSLGLNVKKARLKIMLLAGCLTAIITAFCGPIGFVGVVVPHFSRLLFKTFDHKQLFMATILTGINIMLIADLVAHLPGSAMILPINSITSLIGIPFIFWMLLRKKMITAV